MILRVTSSLKGKTGGQKVDRNKNSTGCTVMNLWIDDILMVTHGTVYSDSKRPGEDTEAKHTLAQSPFKL